MGCDCEIEDSGEECWDPDCECDFEDCHDPDRGDIMGFDDDDEEDMG